MKCKNTKSGGKILGVAPLIDNHRFSSQAFTL